MRSYFGVRWLRHRFYDANTSTKTISLANRPWAALRRATPCHPAYIPQIPYYALLGLLNSKIRQFLIGRWSESVKAAAGLPHSKMRRRAQVQNRHLGHPQSGKNFEVEVS